MLQVRKKCEGFVHSHVFGEKMLPGYRRSFSLSQCNVLSVSLLQELPQMQVGIVRLQWTFEFFRIVYENDSFSSLAKFTVDKSR